MTRDEVIDLIKRKAVKAGSQSKLAKELGITPVYLGDVLLGKRDPGPSILTALGLRREIVYKSIDKK